MNGLGLYAPGTSVVHRLPAEVKLLFLCAIGAASVFLEAPTLVVVSLLVALALYGLAGFGPLVAVAQVWPLRWTLAFIVVFQWWAHGWAPAMGIAGVIIVLVMLAALVTLTTPTSGLVEALVRACRPLGVVGIRAERVGLVLALGIRSVPVVSEFWTQVRDAQRARGLSPTPRAYAAPLIVKALRHADALGDALAARGLD